MAGINVSNLFYGLPLWHARKVSAMDLLTFMKYCDDHYPRIASYCQPQVLNNNSNQVSRDYL